MTVEDIKQFLTNIGYFPRGCYKRLLGYDAKRGVPYTGYATYFKLSETSIRAISYEYDSPVTRYGVIELVRKSGRKVYMIPENEHQLRFFMRTYL